MSGQAVSGDEWLAARLRATRIVLSFLLLGAGPILFTAATLLFSYRAGTFAFDFHHELWPGGRAVLDGRSPFPPASPDVLASGANFIFPAPTAFAMAPFALIPATAADIVFTVILAAAVLLTLRVLGVRDWRCYGAAFLWAPVYYAVQNGNLTLLLGLGVALAWRYRDRPAIAAVATASVVAAKVFLWPLLVWLLATRRLRAAALATLTAAAVSVASWAGLGLGWNGFVHYVDVLRVLARLFDDDSYTLFALGLQLGMPSELARAIGLLLAGAVLAACAVVGRRQGGDRSSLVLALAAALLFSPIVWIHYFALLLVPLAIARPRFSAVWVIPVGAWFCPGTGNGAGWQTGLMLFVAAAVVLVSLVERNRVPDWVPGARGRQDVAPSPVLATEVGGAPRGPESAG